MVHSSNHQDGNLTLPLKIASAGLAGCTADLCTFPLDTVKVWLQVRGENGNNSSSAASQNPPSRSNIAVTSRQIPSTPISKKTLLTSHETINSSRPPISVQHQRIARFTVQNSVTPVETAALNSSLSTGKRNLSLKSDVRIRSPSLRQVRNFVKVKSQPEAISRSQSSGIRTNPGVIGTIARGVRSNGFFSLYGGISAGLQRQVAFCAVRIGLYDSVKGFYHKIMPGSANGKQVGQRILAGTTTAFIAVGLFQPTEVVKIRMQAQSSMAAQERTYSNTIQAYRSIFKVGFRESWKGLETNAARLAVVNVCELVTYDVVKEMILDYRLMTDNPACHFTSAFLSGFITTVVASPIDVVKTRYMNSKPGQYKGPLECARGMLVNEGLRAFYKGFVPAYLRLGSWNIVMFVSYEQYKSLFTRHKRTSDLASKQKAYL